MRNYLRLLIALTTVAASVMAQEGPRADRPVRERRPDHVSSWTGNVVIRTVGARVLVLVDTPPARGVQPDGIVDLWFVLETAEPLLMPINEHVGDSLLAHSAGVLEVSSAERRFEFVLEGDSRPDDVMITRVVGVGLSHHKGEKTGVRIADEVRSARVSTTCMACEVLDPDPGEGGGSGTSCSSGGPGATSCTATQAGNSCSITCASGRYACCNYGSSGSPYCRCVSG
jgi:hypothetical protein